MLNADDLASTLSGAMNNADNANDAFSNFTDALKNYVLANIQITGIYNGIKTPPGGPDPLNGVYTWAASSWSVSADNIQSGATSGISGFETSLQAECLKITFTGPDISGRITIGDTVLIITNLNIDMSGKPDSKNSAFQQVALGIITALQSATATSSSAVSSDTGVGIVAWEIVK